MIVIDAGTDHLHDPPYEFTPKGLTPYSECPERAESIRKAIAPEPWLVSTEPGEFLSNALACVHDPGYLHYLERIHHVWRERERSSDVVIPDMFALRDYSRRPTDLLRQTGYYCFDAQTPIMHGTYRAALGSAACALTGADLLLSGERAVYALCRPPGHHAAADKYGGYCYLNNAALAAHRLSGQGKVAILDVDYHHGNGTQSIFYDSDRVLFISVHADPSYAYPFYSGYRDETGTGAGIGLNHNLPLPSGTSEQEYGIILHEALEQVARFAPAFLVVSLGVDTYALDPLGDFALSGDAFRAIGERIASAGFPALLVQEGGYHLEHIGMCVVNVLRAFRRSRLP